MHITKKYSKMATGIVLILFIGFFYVLTGIIPEAISGHAIRNGKPLYCYLVTLPYIYHPGPNDTIGINFPEIRSSKNCFNYAVAKSNNPAYCTFPLTQKNQCYYSIASNTLNITLCEQIQDGNRRYDCYKNIFYKHFREYQLEEVDCTLQDAKKQVCLDIKEMVYKDLSCSPEGSPYCYIDLAVHTEDNSYCEKIPASSITRNPLNPKSYRFLCEQAVLAKHTPVGNCKSDECIQAAATAGMYSCNKYLKQKNVFSATDCIKKHSRSYDDATICEMLDYGWPRSVCISTIAVQKGSSDICELIETAKYRNKCFAEITYKTGDGTLCTRMSGGIFELKGEEELTNLCLSNINKSAFKWYWY